MKCRSRCGSLWVKTWLDSCLLDFISMNSSYCASTRKVRCFCEDRKAPPGLPLSLPCQKVHDLGLNSVIQNTHDTNTTKNLTNTFSRNPSKHERPRPNPQRSHSAQRIDLPRSTLLPPNNQQHPTQPLPHVNIHHNSDRRPSPTPAPRSQSRPRNVLLQRINPLTHPGGNLK